MTTDPDLTALLERGFRDEPPQPTLEEDLARGRRALRRHRARTAGAGLGVIAASGLVAVLVPWLAGSEDDSAAGYAAGPAGDAEIARACVHTDNIGSWVQGRGMSEKRMQRVMGDAEVMTRADSGDDVFATVRSEDGRAWGECFLPYGPRSSYKHAITVFRTDVSFDSVRVDGRRVYQPQDEDDPRLWGSDGSPAPTISTPCPIDMTEDEPGAREARVQCDRFLVAWLDRRPPEVAAVEIRNPDGTVGRADVHDGYVSYAYQAPMTSEAADRLRSGDVDLSADVTFLDADGAVLAEGALRPGAREGWPASASGGVPALANYPTLAFWPEWPVD